MKPLLHPDQRRRGSVLLVVIMAMTALSLFALGTTENTRTLVDTAVDGRRSMHAQFAADSAVAYVQRQLALDADWDGTSWTALGDGVDFRVTKIPGPPGPDTGFIIEALADGASVKLRADYQIGSGSATALSVDHAVAFLGGDADFNNVEIFGDLLMVDTEGGVNDYNTITGDWEQRTSGGDPVIQSNNNHVSGDVSTSSGNAVSGLSAGGSTGEAGRVSNPRFDLDQYLVPGPGVEIYTNVSQFKKYDTPNTVVVINPAGSSVEFKQCEIGGGVVMWAPDSWPTRGPAYNEITWTQSKFGTSTGGSGAHDHIGVLAPAARLDKANAANPGYGLFYFSEMGHMNNAEIHGAFWVVNETDQWNNVDVHFDPALTTANITGMTVPTQGYVNLVKVVEYYESAQVDI